MKGYIFCVCAIGVIAIFITNAPQNSPEAIYQVTQTTQTVTAPKELRSIQVCNRIDGCPIVKGVCETCQIVKR